MSGRLRGSKIPPVSATFLSVSLLYACDSSIGLREKPNPWDQICAHGKTYLRALENDDEEQTLRAQRLLEGDASLMEGDETWEPVLQKIADAAAVGNPRPARKNYVANCME